MEIKIFYSSGNTEHRRTADMIHKAVKNLGLSASITESEAVRDNPLILVDGIDMSGSFPKMTAKNGVARAYDSVVKLLEKSAWNALW